MENKEIVEIEESKTNETEQSKAPLKSGDVKVWRRIIILALGLVGIYIAAFLAELIVLIFTKDEDTISNLGNIIAYVMLFIAMVCMLIPHFPECLSSFKGWKPYVFGLAGFVAITSFDRIYLLIVNLFYQMPVGNNETAVRSVITQFPVLSIIVLGILGPACEELAYRSGAFNLIRRWNKVAAYIIVSVVFGLIHFRPTADTWISELLIQPVYIFSGVTFCFLYDKFGFASSFAAHTTNNLYAVGSQIILNLIEKYV